MSAGLAALLDDVAVLTRAAAASLDDVAAGAGRAGVKAAGVIVDDAAVTPRYVEGFNPQRELPVIKKIAIGSLRNKLVFILPAALLLSELVPCLVTPLLMVGGPALCCEGAGEAGEPVGPGPHGAKEHEAGAERGPDQADQLVRGARRRDLSPPAETRVIPLSGLEAEP